MIVVSNGIIILYVFMLGCVIVNCRAVKNNRMIESTRDIIEDGILKTGFKDKLEEKNEFEPRKKKDQESKDDLLKRIIPMLATPFIMQTIFLPMVLLGIKFMLLQSIFMGKMAILFWTVNLITNKIRDQQGQFYSHNVHIPH